MDLRDQIQTTLGDSYTVERELGGGGMSHVFVAVEVSLGRRIVVKVLPPESVAPVALERFKREIKLAASLQHPHIVPLLSAGDIDGLPYYTMPFVKGESLRERLVKSGELSVKDTLHVLRDVASALAYAHAEGVVHRDIKPDNIMLSGGVAVVTDFGVAKAVDVATMADGGHASGLTSLGVALGTPAYMAPEQASAEPHVDHRADIYSFGCVAYEMLAGSSPFAGRPMQQMLAAHVAEQPEPLIKRRPAVPPALAALVMKCLEKRAGDRPQSANELLAALDAISTPSGGMEPTDARLPPARRRRVSAILVGAVALVVAAAGGAGYWILHRGQPVVLRPGRVTPVATSAALEMAPAVSPDGKFVAYMQGAPGSFRIMVRQIAGERATMVSGELTSGSHENPRWSPDGSQIAFEANGGVYVVPATGGAPKLLVRATTPAGNVSWSPDGRRVAYADLQGLWIRDAAGGAPTQLVRGSLIHSVAWSPDGRKVAYVSGNYPSLSNQSSAAAWVIAVAGGTPRQIAPPNLINLSPVWLPDSRGLLYISNRNETSDVYQQAIADDGSAIGVPQRLTTGLGARTISLSADGRVLAYDVVRNQSNLWAIDLPPDGAPAEASSARRITNESQRIEALTLSHDGQWLAFDSNRNGNFDIYRVRIGGGEVIQVTTNPANEFGPSWSLDDRRILFHSARTGHRQVYSIGVDGTDERQLTNVPFDLLRPDLSPDGKQLLAFALDASQPGGPASRYDIIFTQNASEQWSTTRRLTPADQSAIWARWSPDGKFVAYTEDLRDLYGRLRLIPSAGGASRLLYDEFPGEAVAYNTWTKDPAKVYFNTLDSASRTSFYSIPVTGGKPRLLFRDDPDHRIGRPDFATDGRRLFVTIAADESDVYTMELRRP